MPLQTASRSARVACATRAARRRCFLSEVSCLYSTKVTRVTRRHYVPLKTLLGENLASYGSASDWQVAGLMCGVFGVGWFRHSMNNGQFELHLLSTGPMEMQAWRALWEEPFEWGFDRCGYLVGRNVSAVAYYLYCKVFPLGIRPHMN
jgi:hypothetical protein